MRFNSLVYWLFLTVVVLVLWGLPQRAKRAWLLVVSYVFYASWHYPYVLLLFGAAAMNHFGARWIVEGDRKRRGTVVLGANLLLLALFKYLDWLIGNLNAVVSLFDVAPVPLPGWVLPLGISFYLFQCMSYIIDLVRNRERLHSFWDFQLYITYFPQLIAGPIMRAKEFLPQVKRELSTSSEDVRSGLGMIASGAFIKIVLADGLARSVDQAFARSPASLSSIDVAIMAIGFGLQIYFDFSAYSRIAIGSARLCGIDLVQNFNHPYVARTPADFWNRWHMSLSRWIRDYLFYPLVGRKASLAAMSKAAIISMTLCGIWHGAGWTFVLWGLYHGLLLAGYHAVTLHRRGVRGAASEPGLLERFEQPASVILTFGLVTMGWLFFRAQSVDQAFGLIGRLITPWAHTRRALSGMFYLHVTVLIVGVWMMPTINRFFSRVWATRERNSMAFSIAEGLAAGALIASCLMYMKGQTAFIYFQF